jgi:hypothetical protein
VPDPFGAHLLCEPNAECRHEMCELLWGDIDDGYALPTCDHDAVDRAS